MEKNFQNKLASNKSKDFGLMFYKISTLKSLEPIQTWPSKIILNDS